jgi:hypothetical protein
MKSTNEILQEGKNQWNKVKSEMEQLSVQLALGRSEAKEAFEREFKKVSSFMDEQGNRLRRHSYWADQLLDKLVARTGALKNELKLDKPDNEKHFSSWREGILRIVYELEFLIDELYPVLDETEKELMSSFRIKMELYRTRLIMTSFEDLASLDEQSAHLVDKSEEVLIWRDKASDHAREKIQRFNQEISTAFDHMKSAFSGLFK